MSNLTSGKELKESFCLKNQLSPNDYIIRMFFAGMEITNEHFLYQYNIKNDFKIQVMKIPRPKTEVKKDEKNEEKKKEKNEEKEKKEDKKEKNEKESEYDEEIINNNDGVEKAEEVENENEEKKE